MIPLSLLAQGLHVFCCVDGDTVVGNDYKTADMEYCNSMYHTQLDEAHTE